MLLSIITIANPIKVVVVIVFVSLLMLFSVFFFGSSQRRLSGDANSLPKLAKLT